jgi:hypothetical protein
MAQTAQSEAARAVRHISIELRKNGVFQSFYTFLLNPETLTQSEKPRAPVTQTLVSAYIEKFGLAPPEISFGGTTGFHARQVPGGGVVDGYERFHTLRNNVFRLFFSDGALGNDYWQMFLYQWEDSEFWEVFPMQFDLQRSKNEPILYRYSIRFIGLRKLDTPASTDAQTHTSKVTTNDPVTAAQQDTGVQVKRAYDTLVEANQLLRCEAGARYETLSSWRSAWRTTSAAVAEHVDNVTTPELYNETNFPGSAALQTEISRVLNQQDAFIAGLKSYLDGMQASIPLRATAAQDLLDACRNLVTDLENLTVRPVNVIHFVQNGALAAGILRPYTALFKPLL